MGQSGTYGGLRVLELATTIAGPYCAMILAAQGADVIKLEPPGGGDDARRMPPHVDGESAVFHSVNQHKRSVVLDLKSPAGLAAGQALADRADVVVQNYRPGVADRLGLSHRQVLERNPGAVYCSISAFGSNGSEAGAPGYDPLIQAFTGMMSMTGEPGRPPARAAASIIDLTTGMWAAMAIMAALARRVHSGVGEHVEITMVDSGYALLCHQILGLLANGEVPGPLGSASPITAPYEAFPAADGWLLIAAGNDGLYRRLCQVLGCPELATDPRFASPATRVHNREALHAAITERLAGRSRADCLAQLRGAGIPAGPVHDLAEAVGHPLVAQRRLLSNGTGPLPTLRLPICPAEGEGAYSRAPELGEHTEPALREAGLPADQIASLVASARRDRAGTDRDGGVADRG
jgi:crotonobetainyl-CoA:carnitine CoA-transferase CaiB-like acyl-CoA transferase